MSPLTAFVLPLVIGAAFGWSLERAGLGQASKLARQFYLRDFTVVKVMLSAILTAMLGAFWLGRLGVIDIGSFYVPETFLLPQVVGGLVFGVGFAISGLCPGTSCVAAASGRGDGAATVAGFFLGVLGTGLMFPMIATFYGRTALGVLTLPDVFGLSYGVTVALITAAGLATFVVIERFGASR